MLHVSLVCVVGHNFYRVYSIKSTSLSRQNWVQGSKVMYDPLCTMKSCSQLLACCINLVHLFICNEYGIYVQMGMCVLKHAQEASKRRGSISGVMDGEVMLRWLQAEKSLRGQGIKEGTVLTLRLKFWNKQIDQNDPVQLNLICAEVGCQWHIHPF